MQKMKPSHKPMARKRRITLTLNEDLITQAKSLTESLSGLVEALLAEFIEVHQQASLAEKKALAVNIATWNKFGDTVGSFANKYSTL